MTFRAVRADKTDAGQDVRFVDDGRVRADGRRRDVRVTHSTVNYKDGLALSRQVADHPPLSHGARHRPRRRRRELRTSRLCARRRGDPDWLWAQRDPFRRLRRKGAGERGLARQAAKGTDPGRGDGDRHRGLHCDAGGDGDRASRPRAVRGTSAGDRRGRRGRLDGDSPPRRQGLEGHRLDRPGDEADYLKTLGAAEIIERATLSAPGKPLGKEQWAAAVDSVGSTTLANVLAQTRYGGAVAACGIAGGMDLPMTVAPFILRGVALLGIDSVQCPCRPGSKPGGDSRPISTAETRRDDADYPLR